MSVIVFEWFDKKRGLANGIIYSGTYLGGVVVPFVVEILLNKFGLKPTFISLAIGYAILIASVLPFVKGRLPASVIAAPSKADWSFLRNPKFIILVAGNLLQGIGNFIPTLWLPTFATDLNLNVTAGTLTVVLMNSSIVLGHFADKYDLRIIMLVSILGSSLSVFLLWGLASTLPPLLVFALIYGFLAAPFSSLWPKFCSVVSNEPHLTVRLMGIFVGSRGIGNILAGPVSTVLLRTSFSGSRNDPNYGYQLNNYGPLIIFTGATILASTIGALYNSAWWSTRKSETTEKLRAQKISGDF
ncbi:major facilitator superfamily transporter [Ceratobasidium sp. AG-Ba]|nr:major facilitator superfamily transporter [Ceratobasidium sp. AG-Ba]